MAAILALAAGPPAQAASLTLSPEQTQIRFELDSTLHRVHGTAKLLSGEVRFSPQGGEAGGRIVIDARSLETGNGLRDGNMHGKVLESERFPEIEFLPKSLEVTAHDGTVGDGGGDGARRGTWQVVLAGTTKIHGGTWPLEIAADVTLEGNAVAHVHASFVIPYVAWGMRDMSNFLLSVENQVHVELDATGRITADAAAQPAETDPVAAKGEPG